MTNRKLYFLHFYETIQYFTTVLQYFAKQLAKTHSFTEYQYFLSLSKMLLLTHAGTVAQRVRSWCMRWVQKGEGKCSCTIDMHINSFRPSGAYVSQNNKSPLVQLTACGLFSARYYITQCELIVNYALRDKWVNDDSKYSDWIWKYRLWNGAHFVLASMC